MKKLLLITFLCLSVLAAHADEWIKGSGKLDTAIRKLPAFYAVNVPSSCNVRIIQSDESKVVVVSDHNIIGYVQTEVKRNELTVALRNGKYKNITKMLVTVYTPHLNQLIVSGSADVKVESFHDANFDLQCLGSGDVYLEDFCVETAAVITMSGSGDVDVAKMSSSRNVAIHNSGSGELDIEILMVENNVVGSNLGSGDLTINSCTANSLTLENVGSGDIEIDKCRGFKDVAMTNVSVKNTGSGDFEIENLKSALVNVFMKGSGDVRLSGETENIKVELNGSGDMKAASLTAQFATISQIGSGDVFVNVIREAHLNKDSLTTGKFKQTGSAQIILDTK